MFFDPDSAAGTVKLLLRLGLRVVQGFAAAMARTASGAKGVPGELALTMRERLDEQVLRAQRMGPRRFKRREAVASYLHDVGAKRFEVKLDQWSNHTLEV